MTLGNYLAQSIIFSFYGFGFGLFGRVAWAVAALIWTAYMLGWRQSYLRLKKHGFGPAEWLWRSVSYRCWQPMILRGSYLCRILAYQTRAAMVRNSDKAEFHTGAPRK
jgi:uncharacterized protein